jgi:SAM-dependent methyltransferase
MTADDRRSRILAQLQPYIERARAFSGWNFADVNIRHLGPPIPWDYEALARDRARSASHVLDLGTDGGEVLARVVPGIAARIVATEEWHVNAPIAAKRLRPFGTSVLRADSLRLPLRAASFDLVTDRHEALDPAEAARVLAPGGTIITQQCGPDDWPELRRFFSRKTRFEDHFAGYQHGFAAAGLTVETARWHEEPVAFSDLGDVVYMLLVAPWCIPNFDPAADIAPLLALEDALRTSDGIVLTEHRYLIVAHKPR